MSLNDKERFLDDWERNADSWTSWNTIQRWYDSKEKGNGKGDFQTLSKGLDAFETIWDDSEKH